jgi:hypothetical membrane protein
MCANIVGVEMKPAYALLAGPVAAIIFAAGIILLPQWLPGYSSIHQTVSEIGMVGSPMQIPFTVMLCIVSVFLLIFGWALARTSVRAGHSPLAGYLAACMAISASGAGLYAFPAAPHNYFGMSELVAYQAPLILAITWRRDPRLTAATALSWVMAMFMWIAIALNLSVLDRGGSLWGYERSIYGLVQRSLFIVFFLWCAGVGAVLFGDKRRLMSSGSATAAEVA